MAHDNARGGDRALAMVTGAYPPDVCGVGDYTSRLMAAAPASWQPFVERDWSPRAAPNILRRLLRLRPRDVVVQYPTQGYGWSLVPHLLVVAGWLTRRYRPVLALHEFTSLTGKAQLALALASHAAAQVIFTTAAERDRARAHRLFSSRVPTTVIGILSNIPFAPHPPAFGVRGIDVAYFGHIRPNKGLEAFLNVMTGLRAADPAVRIAVIGEVPNGYEAFGDMVAERCRDIGATMTTGLDDAQAGAALADVRILYLPFPDGVSARRGSVLAGLGNGVIVATSIGDATPSALLPAIVTCAGTFEDVAVLRRTLRLSATQATSLQQAGGDYINTMLPRDWAQVAALYDRALGRAAGPAC